MTIFLRDVSPWRRRPQNRPQAAITPTRGVAAEGTSGMTTTHDRHQPARRADAGRIRLTQRDIDGLVLCAEHGGAPYDLLATALDVTPARLRAIVTRWRHAGYAATGRLGPGPAWCWLTPAGMTTVRPDLPGHPARAGPARAPAGGPGRPAVIDRPPWTGRPTRRGGTPNAASAPTTTPLAPRTAPTPKSTGHPWKAIPTKGRCGRSRSS